MGEPILRILNISGARPVSLACHDSRNEALRKYKDDRVSYHVNFGTVCENSPKQYAVYSVQYDPLRDTILLSNDETLGLFYDSYDILPRNGPVADIRVLPIKSLALRCCQPLLHESHTVFYTTKMFDLEELILVDTTVGPNRCRGCLQP
jgi:hypothetical protein